MLLKSAALALLLAACGPCSSDVESGGQTPFIRCNARDPVAVPSSIGGVKLSSDGRVLALTGIAEEPRIAVFQGPGMATSQSAVGLATKLAAAKPDLVLILGGTGPDPKAPAWLTAIAKLGPPIFVLAGGRETPSSLDALSGLPAVVDLRGFVALDLRGYRLILAPGSSEGRESISAQGCGLHEGDMEAVLAAAQDKPEAKRVLVSWEIPGESLAKLDGLDLGSVALAGLRKDGAISAGIYAWPDVAVARPVSRNVPVAWGVASTDLELVVPRALGATHVRPDGTRQPPGFVVVRLAASGLIAEIPALTVTGSPL